MIRDKILNIFYTFDLNGVIEACWLGKGKYESECVSECKEGEVEVSDGIFPRYCESCHGTCKSCSGVGDAECSTCFNGFYLDGGNSCVATCGPGFREDDVTKTC